MSLCTRSKRGESHIKRCKKLSTNLQHYSKSGKGRHGGEVCAVPVIQIISILVLTRPLKGIYYGNVNMLCIFEFGHRRALNPLETVQNHVNTIPRHTAFDPQSIMRFGQT